MTLGHVTGACMHTFPAWLSTHSLYQQNYQHVCGWLYYQLDNYASVGAAPEGIWLLVCVCMHVYVCVSVRLKLVFLETATS